MFWLNGSLPGWINESTRQVVVVSAASDRRPPDRYLVKFVDWETGAVTSGPAQSSLDAVRRLKEEQSQ
jgi:hypothetical protein